MPSAWPPVPNIAPLLGYLLGYVFFVVFSLFTVRFHSVGLLHVTSLKRQHSAVDSRACTLLCLRKKQDVKFLASLRAWASVVDLSGHPFTDRKLKSIKAPRFLCKITGNPCRPLDS